jgi:hypothetical protein
MGILEYAQDWHGGTTNISHNTSHISDYMTGLIGGVPTRLINISNLKKFSLITVFHAPAIYII